MLRSVPPRFGVCASTRSPGGVAAVRPAAPAATSMRRLDQSIPFAPPLPRQTG